MYLPPHFAEPQLDTLHRIVRDNALGMLVTHTGAGLDANHLPFLLDADEGPAGVLRAHVARANPVWREVAEGAPVMVVFRGVQGYISPSWYPSKHQTHRHVPTWNYEAVHAHGTLHVRDDEKFVRGLLARLTRQHEAAEAQPWKMSDAPPDFLAEMLGHIVGIEVRLTRLEGKRKLSQNRERADRDGAINTLQSRGQDELAQAMRQASP
ncbi:MAG TPA: FMN-binding negative transcriptional regulator [Ideonella sp.]|uniref:FMN-binding negative transcriptional regulator n=1 Tax=Ideonella sp. TaxID=1929293 RepID=UPI002B83E198|nr:FMN-binding negative transcriptional regulator [Ideonella sp.]HSI48788.1 FMN-binding negative transcriptional regulator [Ideonella sp.]